MNYIILFITSIIVFIILFIDYFAIYEHFDTTYRTCQLHNFDNDICSHEFSNLSKLQLIYKYIHSPNDQDKISKIFDLRKTLNFDPCYYKLNNLKETDIENDKIKVAYKILNKSHDNNGQPLTYGQCFLSNHNSTLDYDITDSNISYREDGKHFFTFNTHDSKELSTTICNNKDVFFQDFNTPPSNINFLKIQLNTLDNTDIVKARDSISFDSISFVSYDSTSKTFIENKDQYIKRNFFKNLLSIAYDNDDIYFVPFRNNAKYYVFSKNMCNDLILDSKSDLLTFDLSMIGFINKKMIKNNNIYFNEDSDIYNLSSSEIPYETSKEMLLKQYDNHKSHLLKNKINEYKQCKKRFDRKQNTLYINKIKLIRNRKNTSNIDQNIKNVTKKIKDIESVIHYLNNNTNFNASFSNKENNVISHCSYDMSNNIDVKAIYNDFTICKNNLNKLHKDYKNQVIDQTKIDDHIHIQIENIDNELDILKDFFSYVDNNNLLNTRSYSTKVTNTLDKHKNKITNEKSGFCTVRSHNGLKTIDIKDNINKIQNKIQNDMDIDHTIFDNITGSKVSTDLLQYVSQDDCIYIEIINNLNSS